MESFFSRYKNPLVLMAVLLIQVIGLATQVKRPDSKNSAGSGSGTRLIRIWTMSAVTPVERAFVGAGHFFRNTWRNYIDLHDVRRQNRELQAELDRMRLEQVRLREDASQAHRLQALLGFREKFISQTVVAQAIGSSGTDQSRVITIDKGSRAGVKPDMAVITPDGIVGKVREVTPFSAQVLMINDHDSGAGVILEKSRLQGILKGTVNGELVVSNIMSDEKIEPGEQVITSGGDRIFPKGLPVGTVSSAAIDRDTETFLAIKVRPSANLNRLDEVLVITKMTEEAPVVSQDGPRARAADILAERLPVVPKKPDDKKPQGTSPGAIDPKKTPAATTDPKKQTADTTGNRVAQPPPAVQKAQPSGSIASSGVETSSVEHKTGTNNKVNGAQPPSAAGKAAGAGKQASDTALASTTKNRVAQPPPAVQKAQPSGPETKKSITPKPKTQTNETTPGTPSPPETSEKPPQ